MVESAGKTRCKLSDEQVAQLREERIARGVSYEALGRRYGIHPKVARRLCAGYFRLEAGGPLEPQQRGPRPARCRHCGGLVYLPCRLCDVRTRKRADRGALPLSSRTAASRSTASRVAPSRTAPPNTPSITLAELPGLSR
jgi:hypothetical protein